MKAFISIKHYADNHNHKLIETMQGISDKLFLYQELTELTDFFSAIKEV